jgi:hypothetical protein
MDGGHIATIIGGLVLLGSGIFVLRAGTSDATIGRFLNQNRTAFTEPGQERRPRTAEETETLRAAYVDSMKPMSRIIGGVLGMVGSLMVLVPIIDAVHTWIAS